MGIFDKRFELKPYEYPQFTEYVDAVRHSYWVHTEFNFTSDIDDFLTGLTAHQKEVLKRALMAISQVEVSVKTFWGDIYKRMPKPEIGAVGFTFAESEVRHMDAYSHLLEILGLNKDFKEEVTKGVLKDRVDYLGEILSLRNSLDNKEYTKSIMLFSVLIENISLFSQFLVIMSYNKFLNKLKGTSNAVEATSKEENIHGMFGFELINIIKKENPEWFTDEFNNQMRQWCIDSYAKEEAVIDWIFGGKDLDFITKDQVKEFTKARLNKSLKSVGLDPVFTTDPKVLEATDWFDNEVITTKHVDFFYKRSINYNKRSSSVTAQDLF